MLRIRMFPLLSWFEKEESGIKRVVEAYHKYLPEFDIEIAESENDPFDITVSHAGTILDPDVVHTHGLYWSADHNCTKAELHMNSNVITAARNAAEVTVPSRWVQRVFERDMRFSPHILGHGIEVKNWEHNYQYEPYVLWNKNRDRDVCSPEHIYPLASTFRDIQFVTTFAPTKTLGNIQEIGVVPHNEMKELIQKAGVYLSTTKETFGIGILEAMAAGVPVLGFDHGGNSEIIEHGVNGYLASPGDYDDLRDGLKYCIENRSILGRNGQELAKKYSWRDACRKAAEIYHLAYEKNEPSVSVVIPVYNYGNKVERAINSAIDQTLEPDEIVLVDDGSTDNTKETIEAIQEKHKTNQKEKEHYNKKTEIKYIYQDNSGVAVARNTGVDATSSKYVCCLDADDKIDPIFLEVCVNALEEDRSLGIAYTGLYYIKNDGEEGLSKWPWEWDFDQQLERRNQVPTCNVMRRKMFDRLGGYRQRYAPYGAGTEDAELWLRSGAYGWKARKVDNRGLFIYSWLTGITSREGYGEVDWLAWHPWVKDGLHPFASYASPVNKISHPVRQYDEPVISVVIPVGPGHGKVLEDALDSLEAQTFRNWEAIVVFDDPGEIDYYKRVYPYINVIVNDSKKLKGPGWARNKGAEKANAGLLLFLDADDWLYPEALEKLLYSWEENEGIIYSDYVAKGKMSKKDAAEFDEERLLHYNEKKQEGVVKFKSLDFNCLRAQKQPEDPDRPYIWNLITSLVPASYHREIGGFDEEMESWEDWDYWIRMAKAGKCFYRVPEDLVVYRFYTGSRRARGKEIGSNLIKYLKNKYKGIDEMGCNCKKLAEKTANRRLSISNNGTATYRSDSDMNDEDFVLIRYDHPNKGQHKVVGAATGKYYGYRGGGEEFYVHKNDVARNPGVFTQITRADPNKEKVKKDTPPPKALTNKDNDTTNSVGLTDIPGISDRIAASLNAMGVQSVDDLKELDVVDLMTIKGVGESTATKILDIAKKGQ